MATDAADITQIPASERDQLMADLEAELDAVTALGRSLPAPMLLYDEDGSVAWANRSMRKLWGLSTRDFGRSVHELFGEELGEYIVNQLNLVRNSSEPSYGDRSAAEINGVRWYVLRWAVPGGRVGAMLLPKGSDQLQAVYSKVK